VVERRFRTNRHAGVPLEGRSGVAAWDPADATLTLWSGTQSPHMARHGLAELLGLPERRVRVIAPDVGGGFGVKVSLYPEDAVLCLLAMRLGRPVKWVEDRLEHMLSASHARDHAYHVRAGFDREGTLLALDADVVCNTGAYSMWPYTAALEPLMAGGMLAGPYKVAHYRCEVRGVATNTAPAGPYRGVARPATVFVMERVLDIAARELDLDPVVVRRRNLVRPEDVPYTAATRLVHDSRTYGACLDAVLERVDYPAFREEQLRQRAEGRLLGVGLAAYNELTGMGSAASAGPRMPYRTGHEMATVRLDPSGGVTVIAGTTSQGQGLETTLAQIAADELGVAYDEVEVRMGDTAQSVFGFGAFASRQGVIGGGAVLLAARAVRDRIVRIAAHLLEASESDLRVSGGRVHAVDVPDRGVDIAEVARVAYMEAHRLPEGMGSGLEETRSYDPG
ncbi:MAG: xanthine dehydrogenase family protein molybdopterin-binding subunit, partial [Candidatus Dormibacteria bacterium]